MTPELLKAIVVVLNGLLLAVVVWACFTSPPVDKGGTLVYPLGLSAPASALWFILRR
jgi:hypothetical protein